jgi:hypothetical protein
VLLLLERGASNVKLKGSNFAQMAFCNNNNDFQNESWWLLKDLEAACFVEGREGVADLGVRPRVW